VSPHTPPQETPHEPSSNVKPKLALAAACLDIPANPVFPDVTANPVHPANPAVLDAPVAHQSSAKSQSFHHAANAHLDHLAHQDLMEIPATLADLDNPADLATQETLAHQDHKAHLDHPETLDEMELAEILADLPSQHPTFLEILDFLEIPDPKVFLVILAHLAVMASLATKDHLDLPDHLENLEPTVNRDQKAHLVSLAHKVNAVSVRNTAHWTAASSLKMALAESKF